MSLFANLDTDAAIIGDEDTLGGGFMVDSGVYDMIIDMAYADTSTGGALSVNLHLKDTASGALVRLTEYVTSGNAKGNSNTYIDQKSGKKRFLPGYNKMDAMAKLASGKDLKDLTQETKMINRFSFDVGKEVPTKTEVMPELLGKQITVGMLKQTVDKNIKNDHGAWVPSGETRDENVADKFFRTSDRMTTTEVIGGADKGVFIDKWSSQNTGITKDKTTNAAPAAISGAPVAKAAAPSAGPAAASLFAN